MLKLWFAVCSARIRRKLIYHTPIVNCTQIVQLDQCAHMYNRLKGTLFSVCSVWTAFAVSIGMANKKEYIDVLSSVYQYVRYIRRNIFDISEKIYRKIIQVD